MGPERETVTMKGVLDPPMFEPDQDLFVWCKRVASWVELISVAATKRTDKQYKTVFATLARQLYDRGLCQAQKSLVEEAQEQGKIDYKQEDQGKAVQEIVDLIAVDPPIAVVTRLIDSFNKVTCCKKKPSEDLNRFVSRFRGLAAEHMMRAGAVQSSQIGEVLAITLLNNASLSESTLTNAKLQLIAITESRKKDAEEITFRIAEGHAKKLVSTKETLTNLLENLRVRPLDNREAIRQKLIAADNALREMLQISDEAVAKLSRNIAARTAEAPTRAITTTGPRFVLSLDDAVSFLCSLAQTSSNREQTRSHFDKNSFVEAVTKEVRTLLVSQRNSALRQQTSDRKTTEGKPFKAGKRSRERQHEVANAPKRSKPNNSGREGPRLRDILENNICKDCGSDQHLRGSDECKDPSFATRKLREAKDKLDGCSEDKRSTGFFRPGSWRTKDKRA